MSDASSVSASSVSSFSASESHYDAAVEDAGATVPSISATMSFGPEEEEMSLYDGMLINSILDNDANELENNKAYVPELYKYMSLNDCMVINSILVNDANELDENELDDLSKPAALQKTVVEAKSIVPVASRAVGRFGYNESAMEAFDRAVLAQREFCARSAYFCARGSDTRLVDKRTFTSAFYFY